MKLRSGTRIEVAGFDLRSNRTWESARIGRWHRSFRGVEKPVGYHPITYDADGARLLCHESGFRVVDNRPNARGRGGRHDAERNELFAEGIEGERRRE